MAVAEYFRDQGAHVLLLADSVTRFAEAHREIVVSTGESASLQGFPATTSQELMTLSERAGPGNPGTGDITAIFSVLVEGSNMEGPIADIMRGVLDGHIVLSREIAERGRFPAIDISKSVSRSLPDAASKAELDILSKARRTIGIYEEARILIKSGLYESGTDNAIDYAIKTWPKIEAFLSSRESSSNDSAFKRLEDCLAENPNKTASTQFQDSNAN
jgi:flagellum-specific ATP synthase